MIKPQKDELLFKVNVLPDRQETAVSFYRYDHDYPDRNEIWPI